MNPNVEFNKIKNHLAFTSSRNVADIMFPLLNKHGITHFTYTREYLDGSSIRFASNGKWNEHYFKKGYINKKVKVPSSYLTKPLNYFIWLKKDWPEMLIDSALNFNISNGISIAARQNDFIEFFGFGAESSNTSIVNNFYINNLDVLQQYGNYFKEKAKDMIQLFEKDKIIIESTKINSHDISFSARQLECAHLLLSGKTSKEIGIALKLSFRTIDDYIHSLKKKLNVRNKSELLVKLIDII